MRQQPWPLGSVPAGSAHCLLLAVPLARKEARWRRWWKKLLWQIHALWEFPLYNRDHSVKSSRLQGVLSIPENKLISYSVLPFHLIALLSWDSWCQSDPWGLLNLVQKEMFELSTSWMKRAQQIYLEITVIFRFCLQVLNWKIFLCCSVMFDTLNIVGI